jgi:hypothetical protein
LLQTWRSIKEVPSGEDAVILQWLISSPPVLGEVIIRTKASASDERLVVWRPDEQGIRWWKEYEQNGNFHESDFI